ncbi:NF041680 family putative transposase [Saccharopolyspora pogona]|uniref:NF041680 family putative transposase n=1 Tax=Saccharopolyspora pogona TaxID=333966 RepID=UPI001CC265AD|nr:NF041680 family putative transposase [Saccharopolyspora pogona]
MISVQDDRQAVEFGAVTGFRDGFYRCLSARADALFELCDAVSCGERPVTSLVELSLSPVFRRGHGALYDALAAGEIDAAGVRDVLVDGLPAAADEGPLLFTADVTVCPRPDAECSADRGHCHTSCRCDGDRKTIPGWNYAWLAGIQWGRSSWVSPVDAVRMDPDDDLVAVTAAQIRELATRLRAAGRTGGAGRLPPMMVMDSGYPATAMTDAVSDVDVQLLIRLDRDDRVFHRPPPPRVPGRTGRPPKYGARFECASPTSWHTPDATLTVDTDRYGRVEVHAWSGLSPKIQARGWFADRSELPVVTGTVVHVRVEHLPDGRAPHKDLWLWWAAPEGVPLDLDMLWRVYLRRFDIEHFFRFAKSTLGWTAAKTRTPAQQDRWTWLTIAAYTQLRLARNLTTDLRRPWERRPEPDRPLSPHRVRRGFRHIHDRLGTPARVPKPTRPGPGRPPGSRSGPAQRHPVRKKTEKTDTRQPAGKKQAG